MCQIISVSNNDDDVEILDYQHNLKYCSIQIKNQAGYILWDQQVQYFQNCPFQEKFEFGLKPQKINVLQKGRSQQSELIINDNKVILKNKDKDLIFYQLFERQQVRMENVQRINQYIVHYDNNNKNIQFSDGMNKIQSIQLTESRQILMINGVNLGTAFQQSDGSICYQGNNQCVYCIIKQNEELELKNFQNFQIGINQLCIEYQFY
ncbi:unnamed protein product [Paramecium sonneborni]|uniref:Uncharacterized protein n=1 Tax=Paramecium sonneborni TaxID=65129 RepID=A0A8S1NY56_9CILI|nr:unnamed protein product [Paramecium sonneborni]